MTQKFLWRGVLVAALCAALAIPARADSFSDMGRNIVIGIVAVSVAVVVIAVVVVHESRKKRTITGCATSGNGGMSLKDEKNKEIYALSGNTTSIKPGDRVALQGKKGKPNGAGAPLVWEVSRENMDYGPCQP